MSLQKTGKLAGVCPSAPASGHPWHSTCHCSIKPGDNLS